MQLKWKINLNAVNQCPNGANIFTEGEALYGIALVIKGRVQIHHHGAKYVVGSGSFLAVNDVLVGKYQSTYTTLEDSIIYVFSVDHKDDLENILAINKDYNGFLITSMNKVIYELDGIYQELLRHGHTLYSLLTDKYKIYSSSASKLGYTVIRPQWVDEINDFERDVEPDGSKVNYYKECYKVPIDVMKSFYSTSNLITLYQLEDQIDLINQFNEILKDYGRKLTFMMECLLGESETCLFGLIAAYAIEVVNADGSSDELINIMDSIIDEVNKIEVFFKNKIGSNFNINRKRIEEVYHLLKTGTKDKEMSVQTYLKYSMEEAENVIKELSDSYQQILNYSGLNEEKTQEMQKIMMDFVNLKDKLSIDENARKIRKQLTDGYYELYKAVFIKAYHDRNVPRIIDMFLKYGYADERLLTNEQLLSLYFLKEEEKPNNSNIYNILEWLTLIYEGKKEPSKNEFDLEYSEMLLSLKKKGQLTDKQIKEWSEDKERKLDYEIQNMFRYNNRTTSGQITTFVPVLHKDILINQPDRSYLTPSKVIEAVEKLMGIDYSIFDREVLYVNKEKNIEKEYIIKRIYPDIILMPTVGSNSIMWQDISGKKRDTPGRFMFPIFCETNLYSLMVKVCGRFRWELCRTIEGMAWNDIKHKSLTSEYSDYLQFYRKNRDLSEERKDKIKLQIQRARNNSREVFVLDYEAWINFESQGAIKLNKIVREIMATYCPFSKKIRERLILQPIFEEAYARYTRERLKKIREVEGRHRLLLKDRIEPTKELVDTLDYYKET